MNLFKKIKIFKLFGMKNETFRKITKYKNFKLWIFGKIEELIKNKKLSAKRLSLICNKSVK
ncbi:hypothetical protein [Malacoplasma iowae]|uniref:Uncharacterized protein n=1 Tax=Malacoplasma iowae 695 TaxID=1048830 RepID=A0A6P1LCZ0_MALIO|nr:hypothetical protein [Malacoplasma iowae]EGZ31030.1 hypothetical protein GUU_04014 [Malacoplasma iowae 695]QHG89494.1 hypothetical protein EER00_01095 [Malacoplasma iowae 695]